MKNFKTKVYLDQCSTEWHTFRNDKIGASDAPIICGVSPYNSPLQLFNVKMGLETIKETKSMKIGKEEESHARNLLSILDYKKYEPSVFVAGNGWQMASLDAYFNCEGDEEIIEIKCSKKFLDLIKQGVIPEYCIYQMQHQMLVMEVEEIKYAVYWKGELVERLVERNNNIIDEINEKEKEFYERLQKFIPPLSC